MVSFFSAKHRQIWTQGKCNRIKWGINLVREREEKKKVEKQKEEEDAVKHAG